MAVLMPEGPGALLSADGEDRPRIRVRLHFGGDFAQEGPHQWRYVGGEVYNESFPVDSKYAEVMKRLNDKFGDTVSFKYLCPGDDMDPENLVQVQGDDDLREMSDEYQNALQKSSTPVKTVRIKVFVFRAVIFEQEVQEMDEELGEDDDLLSHGDEGEQLSSCEQAEGGPNWSEWGEPDELDVTQSSVRSAQFSSDTERYTSAATAPMSAPPYNICMSVNSITSGQNHFNIPPAPLTSVGALGFSGSNLPTYGLAQFKQPPLCPRVHVPPKRSSTHGASGEENGGAVGGTSSGGSIGGQVGSSRQQYGGNITAMLATDALALAGESEFEARLRAYAPSGMSELADPSYAEDKYGAEGAGLDATQLENSDDQLYYDAVGLEEGEAEDEGVEEGATAEQAASEEDQCQEVWTQPEGTYGLGNKPNRQGQQRPQHEEPIGFNWRGTQGGWPHPMQGNWRHDCEGGLERSQLEQQQTQQQTQERQQMQQQGLQHTLEQQQQTQTQEKQNLDDDDDNYQWDVLLPSDLGFYSDRELEDPYHNASASPKEDGPDIRALHVTDVAGVRSSADSDGALRAAPRAGNVFAYDGRLGAYGPCTAGAVGLLERLPAAVDLLPRHISAFGESSRDESKGGTGPLLPSRITIFGDDEYVKGTPGGAGRLGGGGPHRVAMRGPPIGSAAAPWPYPHGNAYTTSSAAAKGVEDGAPDRTARDIMKSVTTFFVTQDMGAASMQEPREHGSGVVDTPRDCRGGGCGKPLGMGESLSRPTGAEMGMGGSGLDHLGSAAGNSHLLKGVVKKRKSEVSILAKIGEGAFGEVSQAQVFPYGIVAIKWLKRERFAKYSESFQREAETLAKLNHPNIIRMYGLVMDTPDTPTYSGGTVSGGGGSAPIGAVQVAQHGGGSGGSGGNNNGGGNSSSSGAVTPTGLIGGIITEFVRNGSLGQYLRSLNGRRLSLRQRAMIALQAALGMAYLHEQSPAVVHFDLKPDNLLVDGEGDSMVIKVADFGLSKHKLSNYVSCRDLRGTLPYMAYELVSGNDNVSEKVDVYSMGVVMWEMYTGEVPFAHLTAQEILTGLLHGNLHLAIPPTCEPEWRSLVETCMDPNPTNRPSFQELSMQLQEILRLERQASNASSVSAATAAAAAAAAVLDSDTAAPTSELSDNANAGYLAQWRLAGMPLAPPAAVGPVVPQARSPRAGQPKPVQVQVPQALLSPQQVQLHAGAAGAVQQKHPVSPPLQQQQQQHPLPPPLLQQQQQQQQQPQQHRLSPPLQQQQQQPLAPFQLQQQYCNLPYALHPQIIRQPTPPLQLPQQQPALSQTMPQQQQQQLQYLQHLTPGLVLQQPQIQVPPAHLYAMPLRPQGLFQPPPQQHGQHLNGLYGMGANVGGGGLPPLVSWADRGM